MKNQFFKMQCFSFFRRNLDTLLLATLSNFKHMMNSKSYCNDFMEIEVLLILNHND